MIITVTLNPALDKTLVVEAINRHDITPVLETHVDAAGKGINVSKTLKALGKSSVATGFIAGMTGSLISRALDRLAIEHPFITVSGETRTNLKIFSMATQATVELNEKGPMITANQYDELVRIIDDLVTEGDWLVLSGSLSEGLANDVYYQLVNRYKKLGIHCLVDASKEVFREALKASPDVVKPNRYELELYANKPLKDDQAIVDVAKEICLKGVGCVVCTLGKDGAIAVTPQAVYRVSPMLAKVKSTVGAGDAFVAGLVYGFDEQLTLIETLKWATATAVAATETDGTQPGSIERVRAFKDKIQVEKEGF